jgi:hypothetical protein
MILGIGQERRKSTARENVGEPTGAIAKRYPSQTDMSVEEPVMAIAGVAAGVGRRCRLTLARLVASLSVFLLRAVVGLLQAVSGSLVG